MPAVDTPYVIGVIREWEKGFLEEDERTRIREAADAKEAVTVLTDTPYGEWLDVKAGLVGVTVALDSHLLKIREWLGDVVTDGRVVAFVTARYDAMNIALAWAQQRQGLDEPRGLSQLGSITETSLHSALWHDLGWETLPEIWGPFLRELTQNELRVGDVMERCAKQALAIMEQQAFTPLMRGCVQLQQERAEADDSARPLGTEEDGVSYELAWDEKLRLLIERYRLEPAGFDPIMAFWYGKELEARQIRLTLTGKYLGLSADEVTSLERAV